MNFEFDPKERIKRLNTELYECLIRRGINESMGYDEYRDTLIRCKIDKIMEEIRELKEKYPEYYI